MGATDDFPPDEMREQSTSGAAASGRPVTSCNSANFLFPGGGCKKKRGGGDSSGVNGRKGLPRHFRAFWHFPSKFLN